MTLNNPDMQGSLSCDSDAAYRRSGGVAPQQTPPRMGVLTFLREQNESVEIFMLWNKQLSIDFFSHDRGLFWDISEL